MIKTLRLIFSHPQYFGVAWTFASLNILFGTWAIYIPIVQEKLQIQKSELGFAIFFLSLGVFTVFPIAPRVINKIGVGKITTFGAILSCLLAPFPLAANHYYLLIVALFFFGMTNGFTDIAMNILVVEIEKKDQVKFMSFAHGFFSLGGIIAGLSSFLIGPLGNPTLHISIVSTVVLVINLYFCRYYFHLVSVPSDQPNKENTKTSWKKPLFIIAVISFIAMGSEGAIVDWSGLYLKEITLAPANWWGLGFLSLQVSMTLGRFYGDTLSNRYTSLKILTFATGLVVIGYGLVLIGSAVLSIIGFFICGLGFSVMVPEVFRICGNQKEMEVAKSISIVAGAGYTGFLSTPPLLGFLADRFSLKTSFSLLLTIALSIFGFIYLLKSFNNRVRSPKSNFSLRG